VASAFWFCKLSRQQRLIALLVTLGLLLLGWWFLENFKMEQAEIPLPPKGEAKYNNLFAAERYLQTLRIPTDSTTLPKLLRSMPPTSAVILIDSNRFSNEINATHSLIDWVRAGGHLILRPGYRPTTDADNALKDELLDSLNISVKEIHEPLSDQLLELNLDTGNNLQKLFIESYSYTHLTGQLESDLIAKDANGIHLIQRKLDQGMVTVLTDLQFLGNHQIGTEHHALALWYLVNQHQKSAKVWLIYSEKAEALASILWDRFNPLIIISSILGVLWLFGSSQRFGPMIKPTETATRSILEHIDANGMHYWRNGEATKLLARRRSSFNSKMNRYHPAWTSLPQQQKILHLVKMTQWSEIEIHRILNGQHVKKREEFTHLIRQIELLEKMI
jgi:hypothetical protein